MSEYNQFAAVDALFNFPIQVRQAIAESAEFALGVAEAIGENQTVYDAAASAASTAVANIISGAMYDRGLLPNNTDINTLTHKTSNGIYSIGSSSTHPNSPIAGSAKLTVHTNGVGVTEQKWLRYGVGIEYRRWITNFYSTPITWSPWKVDRWDKGAIPLGTDIDTLTSAADNGLHRVVDSYHRTQLTGTWPKTPNGLTLNVACSIEVIGAGTGTAMQRLTAPGLAQFTWNRSQGAGGVWNAWNRNLTDADIGVGSSVSTLNPALPHMLKREAAKRRRGGSIGVGKKAVVSLRYDDSMNGIINHLLAMHILHGMPASVVTTSKPFTTPHLIPLNDLASWDMLMEWCIKYGFEVWHHGQTHYDASGTTNLTREIITSAADIRALLSILAIEGWAQPGVGGTNYDGAASLSSPEHFLLEAGRMILNEHALSTGHRPGRVRPLLGDGQLGLYHRAVDEYAALLEVKNTIIPAAQDIAGGVVVMLHPDTLGKDSGKTTVAQYADFLTWLAGERDAGRVEILTMSGMAFADSRHTDRLNLLGVNDFAHGWTTAGWTISNGSATNTGTSELSKTITSEMFDWAYGASHQFRVTAQGLGTIRLSMVHGSRVATEDFDIDGEKPIQIHGVLPLGATSTKVSAQVLSGGIKITKPKLQAV